MKNLNQIFQQVDYAYALLNQQTVIHYNGMERRAPKPVTSEDIAKCKEVLRDTLGDLKRLSDEVEKQFEVLAFIQAMEDMMEE